MGKLTLKPLLKAAALFLTALCFTPTQAQRHYQPHIHVGVHGGATMSRVSFYPKIKESNLMGLEGGLIVRYAEERHVGLQAELNIEQRGWKENFEEYNELFNYHRRTTYLTLPVMTHIFFGSRVVKGFINLGPEIGYMISSGISSNFDYKAPEAITGFPLEYRHTAQMSLPIKRRFDYGITAGAGIEFVIKRRHCIQLEGRYYYGLGNLFGDTKKDEFQSSRGNSIIIRAAYLFRLK